MADSLAGVALGAGAGTRLRPLTIDRPKVMCPVDDTPLVDLALDRLRTVTSAIAVNVHVTQPALHAHVNDRAYVSVEDGPRLGTAGALGRLRGWLDGRAVVVVNGDTWCPSGLEELVSDWDGEQIRIVVHGDHPFGPTSKISASLMPWADVRLLSTEPSGLYEVSWRAALAEGRVETLHHHGPFVDCASPADYLRANLEAAGGSAVSDEAWVEGTVEDSVVWAGARVRAGEHLRRAIRTDTGRTVLVRT